LSKERDSGLGRLGLVEELSFQRCLGTVLLGACLTLGIDSENVAERGQILTILPAHSGTMGQEGDEIWIA